jgi:hypothetical protein
LNDRKVVVSGQSAFGKVDLLPVSLELGGKPTGWFYVVTDKAAGRRGFDELTRVAFIGATLWVLYVEFIMAKKAIHDPRDFL